MGWRCGGYCVVCTCAEKASVAGFGLFAPWCVEKEDVGNPAPRPRCSAESSCRWWWQLDVELRAERKTEAQGMNV